MATRKTPGAEVDLSKNAAEKTEEKRGEEEEEKVEEEEDQPLLSEDVNAIKNVNGAADTGVADGEQDAAQPEIPNANNNNNKTGDAAKKNRKDTVKKEGTGFVAVKLEAGEDNESQNGDNNNNNNNHLEDNNNEIDDKNNNNDGNNNGGTPKAGNSGYDKRIEALDQKTTMITGKMKNNLDELIRRDVALDDLEEKSGVLADGAREFHMTSKKVDRKMWCRNHKWSILIGVAVVVVLAGLALGIAGSMGAFKK